MRPLIRTFLTRLGSPTKAIREETYSQVGENIRRAEKNQQRGYSNRNLSSASNGIIISLDVESRNNKCNNRKQGKLCL